MMPCKTVLTLVVGVLQVLGMFPQYGAGAVRRDLAATRSVDRTVDNILEGRLRHDATGGCPHTPKLTCTCYSWTRLPCSFTAGNPYVVYYSLECLNECKCFFLVLDNGTY